MTEEENKWAEIDEMCSNCKGHATIIQYPYKLCNECFDKILKKEKEYPTATTGSGQLTPSEKQFNIINNQLNTKQVTPPTVSELLDMCEIVWFNRVGEPKCNYGQFYLLKEIDKLYIHKDDHKKLEELGWVRKDKLRDKLNNLHDVFLVVNGHASKEVIQAFREGEAKGRETAIQQIKEELFGD